jgi:hypothetical protein
MREPDPGGEQWDCRNCGQRMQRWRHARGWVAPTDNGYFRFWFECLTPTCRTKQVMPKEGFVRPGAPEEPPQMMPAEADLCAEDIQRLAHFRAI